VFEAWFGSGEDFASQQARGLLSCPICGDTDILKAVMAPAVPAKSNRGARVHGSQDPASSVPVATPGEADMRELIGKLATAQAEMLKDSKWVGRDFANTARAMHYGEQNTQPIHGEVAPAEARALIEEGVNVAPLPLPVVPPEAQN
jgi:hypothetical protein